MLIDVNNAKGWNKGEAMTEMGIRAVRKHFRGVAVIHTGYEKDVTHEGLIAKEPYDYNEDYDLLTLTQGENRNIGN